jgi:hypothetical protein
MFSTAAQLAHTNAPWFYTTAGVFVLIKLLPTWLARLIVIFTKDEDRRLACLEVLRLRRRDAGEIPSYIQQPRKAPPTARAQAAPPQVSPAGSKKPRLSKQETTS